MADQGSSGEGYVRNVALETRLGYHFSDPVWLENALIHASYANRFGVGEAGGKQRLEFLGDAVLGCVLAELLYGGHPSVREGALTRRWSELICGRNLTAKAAELGLREMLRVDGAEGGDSQALVTDALMEDALEAVVGAVFIDGGYGAARDLVVRMFGDDVAEVPETAGSGEANPKGALQEWAQAREAGSLPVYHLENEEGEDHAKRFTVRVEYGGRSATGGGTSRKAAEREAAAVLLRNLGVGQEP